MKDKKSDEQTEPTPDSENNIPSCKFIFTDVFVDSLCYSILIFVFLFSSNMKNDSQKLLNELEKLKPEGYELPSWSHLAPSLLYLGFLFMVNKLIYIIFYSPVKNNLILTSAEENTETSKLCELYIKKSCTSIFKLVFYTSSTILGYYTLKDTTFLPTNLFGNGVFLNIYKEDYPTYLFWARPSILFHYININLAFSLFDCLEVLLHPIQTDFLIMTIHHLSTVSLIVFSTLTNNSHVGSCIIFLHFYGDIFSYIIRSVLYINIDNRWKALATFLFLINFAYTRVYIFSGWIFDITKGIRHTWFFFEDWLWVFLIFLLALHLLWTFMIGKKFVQYLQTGIIIDITKVKKNN